jgi:hypothetical protein
VFIQYYKIVILHFYCHTCNIALSGILYQKAVKDGIFETFKQTNTHQQTFC